MELMMLLYEIRSNTLARFFNGFFRYFKVHVALIIIIVFDILVNQLFRVSCYSGYNSLVTLKK